MKTKAGYRIFILITAVLWFLSDAGVRAEEKTAVLTGGDEDGGYTYLIPGVGNFMTNCKNGGTAAFVYVDPDEGVSIIRVFKDGAPSGEEDGIYLDKGFYEVYIGNDSDQAVFRFSVTEEGNSIIMSLSANNAEINITREPEMKLSGRDGLFRYTLPDGEWIEANVPQGAYTRGTVQLACSPGLTNISGLLNGEFIAGDEKIYRQEGSYIVTFWDLESATAKDEAYRVDFCFRIFRDPVMNLSMVRAPKGMRIAYAKKNGDAYPTAGATNFYAKSDGTYELFFMGTEDTGLSYSMSFSRDTAPPALKFDPEPGTGEVIADNVYFSGGDDVAELKIKRDGAEVTALEGCIKVNGSYLIEIADAAGNYRSYEFTVKNGIPFPVERVIIISAILIIAGGVILIYARKNMQVL
ncbi:MAG: hypothetical protein K5686_08985 [Lachnospiraceae bacterium]|nr:hypothetical protein [Lachnospiraceae bacterium]